MKLRCTPRARLDLIEIRDRIRGENPRAALAVRSAILRSLQMLSNFPDIGRRQTVEGVRKLVTSRYGYLVYYTVDRNADAVVILTIRHPARQRPYSDA
jgi:toxin ParE1/3/4